VSLTKVLKYEDLIAGENQSTITVRVMPLQGCEQVSEVTLIMSLHSNNRY